VQALVTHERGPISFHGALVARGDRGALLLGPSEAGKSGLACALWQLGYALLSGDTARVDTGSGQAGPAPRRIALRSPSWALLREGPLQRVSATPS
jgi:serine kinase of HPr protein (carbohydrate metabolism regulator)